MKQIHVDRLKKLYHHLMVGKLFQDKFNIINYHVKLSCCTVGCALGECIDLFPGEFLEMENSYIFFGLSIDELSHLFYHESQAVNVYGGKWLTKHASPKDVAHNIRDFLIFKGKWE